MVKIHINEDYCKGCNFCIKFCARGVLESSSNLSKRGVYPPTPAHMEKCNACGLCDLYCPDFAIVVEK